MHKSPGNRVIHLAPLAFAIIVISTLVFAAQLPRVLAAINTPPEIDLISNKVVNEETLLSFNVTASDPDGQVLTFSLHNAPAAATIDAATGQFTWTPSEADGPGLFRIEVIVSDGHLKSGQSLLIIVNDFGSIIDDSGGRRVLVTEKQGLVGYTSLYAEPNNITLLSSTELIQQSDPENNAEMMSLTVLEPDGDVCAAQGLPIVVPEEGIGRLYPSNFTLTSTGGDGICNTSDMGTYYAQSMLNTTAAIVTDTAQFKTNSPFVLPESPIGIIAILASSLAVLGIFMFLKGRGSATARPQI